MSELRLAANQVSVLPNGHFQVVFVADDGTQEEIEVQAGPFVTLGNWTYPDIPREHNNEENTPFYGNSPEQYASTTIDLGDRSAGNVWDILTQVHSDFAERGGDINYDTYQNSNSYATTVLSVVGIDIADYAANTTPTNVTGSLGIPEPFPGQGVNVLENPATAISLNLEGTPEGDIIRTGLANDSLIGFAGDDNLFAGGGNDALFGNDGNDRLEGGLGQDTIGGGAGDDTLYGGSADFNPGDGNDTLRGGDGNDWLDGDFGDDALYGDSGFDAFAYYIDEGSDTIMDFDLAEDTIQVYHWQQSLDSNGDGFLNGNDGSVALSGSDLLLDFANQGGGNLTIAGTDQLQVDYDIFFA